MIPNRTFQRYNDVCAVIGTEESQHARGLVFAATLLLQQPFQESTGHFPQLAESLPQLLQLAAVAFRWTMFRIDAMLTRLSHQ